MISVLRFQAASETKKKKVSIGIPWDRCCEATALGKAEPDEAFVELLRRVAPSSVVQRGKNNNTLHK